MNQKIKKLLIGVVPFLLAVVFIAVAPISRTVYTIYDSNRTKNILRELEAEENAKNGSVVNDFHKQAYYSDSQDTVDGKQVEKIDLLVLTSDDDYELTYYERVVDGDASYTAEYFHMTGNYTREGNLLTVTPGIGVLAQSKDGNSYVYHNAQYLTAEEAGSDKTRDEVYDMKYSSRQIALMKDGSFVVGGKSDAKDELSAPEGCKVYTTAVTQGRVTYKTLVTREDGVYYLYSHATNSNNAEQTTGSLFGYGKYEIKDKGIVPDPDQPEQTYDIVSGSMGLGYMYANNNGSHMHFDLQTGENFAMWLATSFNAASPTFYVTESGFTIKLGALKTVVEPWGLYVPSSDSDAPDAAAPAAEGVRLELETSVEGKPFVLELNSDGSLLTGWTNYEQTMQNGKWSVANGALTLDMEYTASVAKNAAGGLDITVNYGQMGEKTYTMTAEQWASLQGDAAPAAEGVRLELETSVEGKPFVLELNSDGTLLTGWTNYEQTMQNGKWSVANGALKLDMEYAASVAKNAAGGLDITINYGQMGEKTYTMTAEQWASLQGN